MFEDRRAVGGFSRETELTTVGPGSDRSRNFLDPVLGGPRPAEDQLAEAGWHCCGMAPVIEATALGCADDVLHRGLSRLLGVTSGDSNAIEITGITSLQFLGLSLFRCSLWQGTSRGNPFPVLHFARP